MSPVFIFLIGYLVVALTCTGLGLYLSEPGHTWSTLKDDALNLLPGRSRPMPIDPWSVQHDEQPAPIKDEPKRPSFFEELQHNADTQYHLVTPPIAPASDEETAQAAADHSCRGIAHDIPVIPLASDESHEEAASIEVVHDEP